MHRVLSGVKTAEVRHQPLEKKTWWIGRGGFITGCATVTNVEHVTDLARWRKLLPRHHWDIHKLPYKRTYVNTLEQVGRVNPVPYRKKKGAIGIVKFAPTQPCADAALCRRSR